MSRRPHFEVEEVEPHGYRVARIRDTKTGELHRVYLRGNTVLTWDHIDSPVSDATLRRVAREALA